MIRTRTEPVKQNPRPCAAAIDQLHDTYPELFIGDAAESEAQADNFLDGLQSAVEHRPAELRHVLIALLSTGRRAAR